MTLRRILSLSLAAAALLAPSLAMASSARLAGLVVPGDYVQDETGRFTYLSAHATQGGRVWAEPSASDNNAMGAVVPGLLGKNLGTFAVNLRRWAPSLGQAMYQDPVITAPLGNPDLNTTGEAVSLAWGRTFGTRTVGLSMQRSFVSTKTAAGTTEGNGNLGRNVTGFGLGYGFPLMGREVETAFHWQNRDFKGSSAGTPDATKSAKTMTWLLAGRSFMKLNDQLTVVPSVRAYSFDLSYDNVAGTRIKQIISGWQAGLAGNWALGSGSQFILGAQFVNERLDLINTSTNFVRTANMSPNVFAGLESEVQPWLTLRFGARNAVLFTFKDAVTSGPLPSQTVKTHVFAYNAGATVKAGKFVFDATLAPNFYSAPVSGVLKNAFGGQAFPQVSVSYGF